MDRMRRMKIEGRKFGEWINGMHLIRNENGLTVNEGWKQDINDEKKLNSKRGNEDGNGDEWRMRRHLFLILLFSSTLRCWHATKLKVEQLHIEFCFLYFLVLWWWWSDGRARTRQKLKINSIRLKDFLSSYRTSILSFLASLALISASWHACARTSSSILCQPNKKRTFLVSFHEQEMATFTH